jgi:TDG/mug DNA glycosylase family protein
VTPDELEALTRRPEPGPHRTTVSIDGVPIETLADLPPQRDGLLFVGLNPSPVSVRAGHYHQGRIGQRFWRRLMTIGIIPARSEIATADDALVAAGHGITDLIKRPSPRDEAPDQELREGVGPLWQKIALWRPGAVVFIYKRVAEIAAGRALQEPWGQLVGVALGGRPCFLMPGPYASTEQVDEASTCCGTWLHRSRWIVRSFGRGAVIGRRGGQPQRKRDQEQQPSPEGHISDELRDREPRLA